MKKNVIYGLVLALSTAQGILLAGDIAKLLFFGGCIAASFELRRRADSLFSSLSSLQNLVGCIHPKFSHSTVVTALSSKGACRMGANTLLIVGVGGVGCLFFDKLEKIK